MTREYTFIKDFMELFSVKNQKIISDDCIDDNVKCLSMTYFN